MNTPKHTPGPWHVGLRPGPMVYGPQGEQIVGLNVMLESDEVLANAKFIAAAPAMYEAIRSIPDHALDCKHSYPHTLACWNCIVKAALAQAEGGAK